MKSLFKQKAANNNEAVAPKTEHIHSGKQVTNSVDLAELFGVGEDGMPKAEILELEWDAPHKVSFAADGLDGQDTFRIYAKFDALDTKAEGQRSVLIAHNITKDAVQSAFDAWEKDALGTPKIVQAHFGYAYEHFVDGPDQG